MEFLTVRRGCARRAKGPNHRVQVIPLHLDCDRVGFGDFFEPDRLFWLGIYEAGRSLTINLPLLKSIRAVL